MGYVSHILELQFIVHLKLRNINPHNVTHFLIIRNPRERMFIVQISLLIVTFFSLISRILSLIQTTKEVNPHPHIPPCVNMWSVTFLFLLIFFLFLCQLLNVGACMCHIAWEGQVEWTTPHHTIKMLHYMLFHNVTCYTKSIVSHIHVNTTKLHNFMCT